MKALNTIGIETIGISGFKAAIYGMRSPLNSWSKSDSVFYDESNTFSLGEKDLDLCKRLIRGGTEHRKFLRMIHVQANFNLPRYIWSELDTYSIGVSKNSCSTIHTLLNNKEEILPSYFFFDFDESVTNKQDIQIIKNIIFRLNELREEYLETKDKELIAKAKRILPECFLQARVLDLNYEVLRSIYHQRKNHILKYEWVDIICNWIESLPYANELIIDK